MSDACELGKIRTSMILHPVNTIAFVDQEVIEEKIPTTAPRNNRKRGSCLFFSQTTNNILPDIQNQLSSLKAFFTLNNQPNPLQNLSIRSRSYGTEALCFFENICPIQGPSSVHALLSCYNILIYPCKETSHSQTSTFDTSVKIIPHSNDVFSSSPIIIFDDRYGSDGFWNYVGDTLHSIMPEGEFKLQLQCIVVPVAESNLVSETTYDLFSSNLQGTGSTEKPSGEPAPKCSKYTVRNMQELHEALLKAEDSFYKLKKKINYGHIILHVKVTEEHRRTCSTCFIRLDQHTSTLSTSQTSNSADVLWFLVHAITSFQVEGCSQESILNEITIKQAFSATSLTTILSKVIEKQFLLPTPQAVPLFHWIVNLPTGTVSRYFSNGNRIFKVEFNADINKVARSLVELQDLNVRELRVRVPSNGD